MRSGRIDLSAKLVDRSQVTVNIAKRKGAGYYFTVCDAVAAPDETIHLAQRIRAARREVFVDIDANQPQKSSDFMRTGIAHLCTNHSGSQHAFLNGITRNPQRRLVCKHRLDFRRTFVAISLLFNHLEMMLYVQSAERKW